jgi:L-seryl-tRNA(Ser) seleniumtransferase
MLTCPLEQIKEKADMLLNMLKDISNDICCEIVDRDSRAGGGALPLLELPSKCICVEIHGVSVNQVVTMMRLNTPPVIGRIEDNRFIMDLRTIQNHELAQIKDAFVKLMATTSNRTASK